jgi:hypothetical protein
MYQAAVNRASGTSVRVQAGGGAGAAAGAAGRCARSLPPMSDERPSQVLGGLPRTRPHRRSEKRAAPAGGGTTRAATPAVRPTAPASSPPSDREAVARLASDREAVAAPGATKRSTPSSARVRQPAQPPGTPSATSAPRPVPAARLDLLGSAVHVSAELAEIGISAGARALRGVVARLPKP